MTDLVDDFLIHHGIKGMKWGVRNNKSTSEVSGSQTKDKTASRSVTLKNGDTLILDGQRTPAVAKILSKMSPKIQKKTNDSDSFKLKTSSGETVGEMFTYKPHPKELNVVWVEVKPNYRGSGYASGAMKSAVDYAKKQKLDKVTLEVPGISPDARHIYEKMGFVAGKQISENSDVWGGLTEMTLKLKK